MIWLICVLFFHLGFAQFVSYHFLRKPFSQQNLNQLIWEMFSAFLSSLVFDLYFFFLDFFGKRIHYSRARTSISSIITAQSQHCRWEWLFITENDTKPQYNGQQQFVVCGVYLVNTIDSIQCYASTVKKNCCALICQWYFFRCAHIALEMGFDFIWRKIVHTFIPCYWWSLSFIHWDNSFWTIFGIIHKFGEKKRKNKYHSLSFLSFQSFCSFLKTWIFIIVPQWGSPIK